MTIVFKKILFLLILLEIYCDSEIEENYYKGVIFMATYSDRIERILDGLRYRAESFKKFSEFKVVMVFEQKDVLESNRSDKVRENIKSLSNYIGILDDDNTTSLATLSKSIGILVIENDKNDEYDEKVFHLKEKLISLIEEKQIFQNKSFKNEICLFQKVIKNDQIELINETISGFKLDYFYMNGSTFCVNIYNENIVSLTNRLSFIGNNDAKIRSEFFLDDQLILHNLNNFGDYYVINAYNDFEMNNFIRIQQIDNENIQNSIEAIDLYYFLKKLVDKLVYLEKNLNYYNIIDDLSPIYKLKDNRDFYEEKFKNFSTLKIKEVNITRKKLVVYIRDQYKKNFGNNFESKFKIDLIEKYYEEKTELVMNGKMNWGDFEIYCLRFKEDAFNVMNDRSENIEEYEQYRIVKNFLDKTHSSSSYDGFKIEDNVQEKLNIIIKNLQKECMALIEKTNIDYYFDEKTSSLIFKGIVLRATQILQTANRNNAIKNLKSVRIYATHRFILDQDFKIPLSKYETHSPDLIIISPVIEFQNNFSIDLSCDRVPGYPNNRKKAESGFPGSNGLPGLPGYNGGNLYIRSNRLVGNRGDGTHILLESNGGKGAPGQDGDYFFRLSLIIFLEFYSKFYY
jgi:hypothetical protein